MSDLSLLKWYGTLICMLLILYGVMTLFQACKKEVMKRTSLEQTICRKLQDFDEKMKMIDERIKKVERELDGQKD